MKARDVKTTDDAKKIVAERDLDYVKVAVTDMDGILRGKYMQREKFFSRWMAIWILRCRTRWDSSDQLYDNVSLTGWHTGYGDAKVRIIPESCRELPLEEKSLLFLAEFLPPAQAVCPRGYCSAFWIARDR